MCPGVVSITTVGVNMCPGEVSITTDGVNMCQRIVSITAISSIANLEMLLPLNFYL